MSNLRAAATTDLYRHYARDGTLLYVGISLSALARLIQHRRSARWYIKITSVRIKKFPSREAAEAAEKIAIEQEKPLFNIFNSSLERRLAERKEPSGPRWPNIMSFSEWCVLRGFSVSTGRRLIAAGRFKVTYLSDRRIGIRSDHDLEYLDSYRATYELMRYTSNQALALLALSSVKRSLQEKSK